MICWGIPIKVAIKNDWMKFPFGWFIKFFGGVGVDRSRKLNKTKKIKNLAEAFIITPEGTSVLSEEWKLAFYYIAKEANVPIATLSCSYKTQTIEFGPILDESEPLEVVLKKIMNIYKAG